MRPCHFSIDIRIPFKEALLKLKSALNAERVSIVSEIDVTAVIKENLSLNFPAQKIFGICSIKLAHTMLSADSDIGTMLPCSVFVREINAENTRIVLQDPSIIANCSQAPEVHAACDLLKVSLRCVVNRLALM